MQAHLAPYHDMLYIARRVIRPVIRKDRINIRVHSLSDFKRQVLLVIFMAVLMRVDAAMYHAIRFR